MLTQGFFQLSFVKAAQTTKSGGGIIMCKQLMETNLRLKRGFAPKNALFLCHFGSK